MDIGVGPTKSRLGVVPKIFKNGINAEVMVTKLSALG
jgi:hypothetical protein